MRIVLGLLLCAFSVAAFADQAVRGYFRQDGTYVAPHFRTSPDGNPHNNWSTRGNVNPHTGERGSVDPYAPRLNQPATPGYQNPYGIR